MAGKKTRRVPVDGSSEEVPESVLGGLLRELGFPGPDEGPRKATPPKPGAAPAPEGGVPDLAGVGKIVLRVQRKGRGGKTVTTLSTPGGGVSPGALEPLAREIRRALGCGARVEDGSVVIQGDNAERAEKWLLQRGAGRVVRGS